MIHGVCPPLTANAKRPRAAIAVRASAAMAAAAARATASASSNNSSFIETRVLYSGWDTEILLVGSGRRVPAPRRHYPLLHLTGAPVALLVFVDRSAGLQHRIYDSPRFLHVIFASKQRGVASHGVSQNPLVRVHLVRTRMTAGDHFDRFAFQYLTLVHDGRTHCNRHFGTDAEPQVVGRQSGILDDRRRFSEPCDHLGTSHRQVLSGADIKRHAFPSP